MNKELTSQLTSLGIGLFIALLVLRHFRDRTFAPSERYSTFRPRFWTGSIDSCVLWPIGFVISMLLCLEIPRGVAALLIAVQSLYWLVYTVVMHARYGQTVGKMVTRVKVVDFRTEGKISWRQAWIRESLPMVLSIGCLGYEVFAVLTSGLPPRSIANGEALAGSKPYWLLAAFPCLWFLAEVLTMLTNKKRRALHDFIAGTVVIRTNIHEECAHAEGADQLSTCEGCGEEWILEEDDILTRQFSCPSCKHVNHISSNA